MAKGECGHKNVKFLKKEEIFYCPDCGKIFEENPNKPEEQQEKEL